MYQTLNAIYQYSVDNNGNFPAQITGTFTDIGTSGLDLSADLVPTYIPTIPYDPLNGDASTTLYVLAQEGTGRLTATATAAEVAVPMTLTR